MEFTQPATRPTKTTPLAANHPKTAPLEGQQMAPAPLEGRQSLAVHRLHHRLPRTTPTDRYTQMAGRNPNGAVGDRGDERDGR